MKSLPSQIRGSLSLRWSLIAAVLLLSGLDGGPRLLAADAPAAPATAAAAKPGVTSEDWGMVGTETVKRFTLTNSKGMVVKLANLGARMTSVLVPDRDGKMSDVILGYDSLQRYGKGNEYGAVMGRVVNRINNSQFTIDGTTYKLAPYNRGSTFNLHSGPVGFEQRVWEAEILPAQPGAVGVKFTYHSPDGDQGFPGNVTATATYTLTDDNELKLDYGATTDKATPFNPANHAYWNLAGSDTAGQRTMLDLQLKIEADNYTVAPMDTIPTGEIAAVAGTPYDFTKGKTIGSDIQQVNNNTMRNYDVNFVLRNFGTKVALAATVTDPKSGRVMEILTDEPAVQLYTMAPNYYGVALETQHFPDATNHPNFPSIILRPGDTFKTETVWKFSTAAAGK